MLRVFVHNIRFIVTLPLVQLSFSSWQLSRAIELSSDFFPWLLDGCHVQSRSAALPALGTGSLRAARTGSLPAARTGSLSTARTGSLPSAGAASLPTTGTASLPSAGGKRPFPVSAEARRPTPVLRLQAASYHHHHVYCSGGSSANNHHYHICITSDGWKRSFDHMRSRVLDHHVSLLWYILILPHVRHPRLRPSPQGQGHHGIWAKE